MFSSVVDASSDGGGSSVSSIGGGGSSVSSIGGGGSNGGDSRSGLDVTGVGDDGGGLGPLDDGLSGDGGGHSDGVGGINMDGGGDLDDPLGVEGSVIRGVIGLVDKDGLLDVVDLGLGLDNGGVDGLGSLEDGGDSDGQMGGGGLQDPGGVARDEAGLAKVHLLGDHGGGLVHGGDTGSLGGGGERSRGRRGNVVDGVGDDGASRVVVGAGGGRANGVGGGSDSVRGDTVADGSCDRGNCVCDAGSVLGRSEGAGQDEGECDKRPHVDGSLPLSW